MFLFDSTVINNNFVKQMEIIIKYEVLLLEYICLKKKVINEI